MRWLLLADGSSVNLDRIAVIYEMRHHYIKGVKHGTIECSFNGVDSTDNLALFRGPLKECESVRLQIERLHDGETLSFRHP